MSELNEKLLEIKRQKDTYIIPENIKKDITVYGVTGTLEPGSSGSGDVKLFDTVEEMQQDPNPQEGDLAIVYRSELEGITEDSEFSSCIFPNTVVLDEAVTGSINGGFGATDQGVVFAATVEVSSSRFIFSDYVESEIIAQYTSQDGITYTRTDGGEELVEFGTTIKWESFFGPFNSIIGNFMKIGENYFGGLYEYKSNEYVMTKNQLNATPDYVYEKTFYGKNGVETGLLLKNISNKFDDKTAEIYSKIIEQYDNMDSIKITDTTWNVLSPNMKLIPVKSNGIPLIDTSEVTTFTNFSQYAQNLKHIPTLNMSNALNCFAMFSTCNNIISVSNLDCSKVQNVANMFWKCANLRDVPYMDLSNVTSSVAMFRDCYNLRNVPNYNLCNSLYTGEMFTGCYNLTQVPDFNITKSTSTQRMFIYCYNLLSAPNLDLRNVTSCNLMFYDCKSLVDVPFYNIKNAGLVYSMFYNCNNLSNNSLNNIMAMCTTITNTNVTNKTLKNIGLSQNQTNICKTLSNYSAFTSAGWTTGY